MIKDTFRRFGLIFSSRGEKYLDWGEYEDRVTKIENLMFLTKTCQSAIRNHWQKEGGK